MGGREGGREEGKEQGRVPKNFWEMYHFSQDEKLGKQRLGIWQTYPGCHQQTAELWAQLSCSTLERASCLDGSPANYGANTLIFGMLPFR